MLENMKGFNIVVLLTCCALKCTVAMNNNELQDFKVFLEKTSALDPVLKDGGNTDEDETDENVSDYAWEESGKFEGDLILSDRQRKLIVADVAEGLSRNGLNDITKRWPNNEVIYYIQMEHFSGSQVQAIEDGIEDLGRSSCVKFRPYKKGDRDAVVIQGSRRGCFSQVGYQGGYQVLNLSGRHPVGRGCFRHGTVVHELLHTLGFYHMQSSPDRDDYINVLWENIIEPAKHNFRKYNSFAVSDFGVGYDYDSVLHYSKRAFSSNGKHTLVPKKDGVEIGQRIGLSDKDTEKLNKMYCDQNSNGFDEDDKISIEPHKRKKDKNKPFQGHGIGYHQGKTMIIKLPAIKTHQLPDVPSYHIFDYFSKSPQSLSSKYPEVFREYLKNYDAHYKEAEKEMAIVKEKSMKPFSNYYGTSQKSPETFHYDDVPPKSIDGKHNEKEDKNDPYLKKVIPNDDNTNEKAKLKENENEKRKTDTSEITNDTQLDEALNDAFDRLRKIIKVHVYPTRDVDLSLYNDDKRPKVITETPYVTPSSQEEKEMKKERLSLGFKRIPTGFKINHSEPESSISLNTDNGNVNKDSKDFSAFEQNVDERLSSILKSYTDFNDDEMGQFGSHKKIHTDTDYSRFPYHEKIKLQPNSDNEQYNTYIPWFNKKNS